MGGPDTVAVEAVLRHREAHLHAIGARLGVTRPAVEQGIRATRAAHRLGVDRAWVKPQVGRRGIGGRPPAHGLFDAPRRGSRHMRPAGARAAPPGSSYASMAAGAVGEEIAVLPVIEAIRRLGVASLDQE